MKLIYMKPNIYIYIYRYHENNVPSRLSPQWLCGNSCAWAHDVHLDNWIMVKIQLSFKYSEFHVNYFTIFSLVTTLSTDVTRSLQCKGIFLSDVT